VRERVPLGSVFAWVCPAGPVSFPIGFFIFFAFLAIGVGCRSPQERDERRNAALFERIVAAERQSREDIKRAPPAPPPPEPVVLQRVEPLPDPPEDYGLRWLRKPVALKLEKTPLPEVLRAFCAQQGVSPKISEKIQGTLSGSFSFDEPRQFLDVLTRNGGLIWYYDGQSVHFYRSEEQESAVLRLRNLTAVELRNALIGLELWDGRWSWRSDATQSLLYVNGPPHYVSLVKDALERMDSMYAEDGTMGVFRLKHALAPDQEVEFHKEKVTIPGVASLLRQIVLGESASGGARSVTAPRFLKGTGMVPPKPKAATPGSEPAPAAPAEGEARAPTEVRIVADPRLNAVLIWDARSRMPYYKALIEQLDQPLRLVEIRAAIIDVSVDHAKDLGFAWDYSFKHGDVTTRGGANQGQPDNPVNFLSQVGKGVNMTTVYEHGMDVLLAKAKFLEESGDASVLSNPAVLTVDNIQAQIRHTQTFYVKLEGKEEVDLVDVTVGTVLQVTPHVIEEQGTRKIQMTVHIEDGTDSSSQSAKVDDVPRIIQSIVDTRAVVGEQQALIIGGTYNEKKTRSEDGVPWLKNLPVVGHLAKNTKASSVKQQRLFVLSPRIVDLDSLLQTQGAGLEPVFDRSRRVDWVQRAFGDPPPADEKRKKAADPVDGR